MLVVALSIDTFIACLAYGSRKIKIPLLSAVIICMVCSLILLISMLLCSVIAPYIPNGAAKITCFIILFTIGIVRVFDSSLKAWIKRKGSSQEIRFSAFKLHFLLKVYADPEIADIDQGGVLSNKEAVLLAAAMSLDGMAAGFGAGAGDMSVVPIIVTSLIVSAIAIKSGVFVGTKLAKYSSDTLSPLAGILLIALSFLKLLG